MAQARVLIIRAPGTNCDCEAAFAFARAGATTKTLHINRLLEKSRLVEEFEILCFPGGFSYGDDIAAGRIQANQIRFHLADALHAFKAAGKLILGICNGFQVLIKSGILLDDAPLASARGAAAGAPPATLVGNASGKFEDRWVRLKADGAKCVFFAGIDSMYLPVAHAEGKFVARDARTLEGLAAAGQIVVRYAPASGATGGPAGYPDNPNGSVDDVAGVCDATGRVCGLMPHPERYIERTQHPRWTRGEGAEEGDGLRVFRNAVAFFG
jgi:phosphoribosylformylglycinamidine synthase subunit PurQ / glutaminase